MIADRIVKAGIIPWEEGLVGVYIDWENGLNSAYAVATVGEAHDEMRRLGADPGRVQSPPLVPDNDG